MERIMAVLRNESARQSEGSISSHDPHQILTDKSPMKIILIRQRTVDRNSWAAQLWVKHFGAADGFNQSPGVERMDWIRRFIGGERT